MPESNADKYTLLCLRLAAECKNLAAGVSEPDLKAHFLYLAGRWVELAHRPRVLH
jgi:hypothetical protein